MNSKNVRNTIGRQKQKRCKYWIESQFVYNKSYTTDGYKYEQVNKKISEVLKKWVGGNYENPKQKK